MADRFLGRLLALSERLLRIGWIAEARAVVEADDEAGGGLLAAALAYRAIFGLLSGLILVAGLIGWAFEDPDAREAAVTAVAGMVPGMEPVVAAGLESLVEERGTLSIVGLLGAAFGASIFYDALDQSMNRVMPGGGQRNPILRRLVGVAAIILLALVGVAALGIGLVLGPATAILPPFAQLLANAAGQLAIIALLTVSLAAIYRWLPIRHPAVGDVRLPALVAAIAIWVASWLYGLLAPLLVRQLAIFGVFVSLLGLLIWLSWVNQLLILGGSWSRVRRDQRLASRGGGSPATMSGPAGQP